MEMVDCISFLGEWPSLNIISHCATDGALILPSWAGARRVWAPSSREGRTAWPLGSQCWGAVLSPAGAQAGAFSLVASKLFANDNTSPPVTENQVFPSSKKVSAYYLCSSSLQKK